MKSIYTLILFVFLFTACLQSKHSDIQFIIENAELNQVPAKSAPLPPQPPITYYGNLNFILLDSAVYIHKRRVSKFFRMCGTGIDHTKPPRMFLHPDSLIKVSSDQIFPLIESEIKNPVNNNYFLVCISSPNDTIRNPAFKTITDFLRLNKINRSNIRHWTEEEEYVITAKIQNKPYNPDSIDWKIGFDEEFSPPIKILPLK